MARNNRQYGSSNVLVRVYEKSLLSTDYFERLIQSNDTEDFMQILEETVYDDYLHRMKNGDVEVPLTAFLRDTYEQIFKVSPDSKVNEYISLRYTYHNIKINFKETITRNDMSHLYIPISPMKTRWIDYAIDSGESNRLPSHYLDSINEVRQGYDQFHDLYAIDVIMDRRYLTHIRLLADEIGDTDLIEFTKRRIDYRNAITLVRAMHQNRTRNFLSAVLSSSGSIPKSEIIELSDKEFSEVIAFYERTHLDKIIHKASIEDNSISTLELEAAVDDAVMLDMQNGKRIVSGPLPMIAYIYAKEIEVKNLRILYYAKSRGMKEEEIRERLRLNYVT